MDSVETLKMTTEPRRLTGHKATATYCIASRDRPGIIATAAEDGCVCWFDMRCKDVLFVADVGNHNPVSSLCFRKDCEDKVYASTGNEVKCLDVHMTSAFAALKASSSWKPLETYGYNKDEINQIACNSKSSFLAAADDGGGVKIIDIHQHCLYKTSRSGHSSLSRMCLDGCATRFNCLRSKNRTLTICSTVQFLPWKPWEVITGGLDSKLIMWDFSKGCRQKIIDFSMSDGGERSDMTQCFNPAFVHALAVPEADMVDKFGKICVVARGDGSVDIIDIESELAANKSKSSYKTKKCCVDGTLHPNRTRAHLGLSLGWHATAVSCVAFPMFGEKGKFVISGGNDKSIKVWDLSKSSEVPSSSNVDFLHSDINLKKKVNWLCTTPTDAENLVVCDTSRVVKVYTVT